MTKIAIIGAGSLGFTLTLTSDVLLAPALAGCTFALMDIHPERLALAKRLVENLIAERSLPARVKATLDRREALKNADYVIVTFHPGGLEAFEHDIDIPLKYGVGFSIGDTLGPGGIFRGLRTIPALLDICRDMDEVSAPDALLLNYSNPMAINTWGVAAGSGRPVVGLCHSVPNTAEVLAGFIDAPPEELRYWWAGINHQAWFLKLEWRGQDAYPLLRERLRDPEVMGKEPIRGELMQHFGYFVTESSEHSAEYVPYYRKNEHLIKNVVGPRFTSPSDVRRFHSGWLLLAYREKWPIHLARFEAQAAGQHPLPQTRSQEFCSYIIEALETNQPVSVSGNVPNTQLITNLPAGCCVEVPCLVDGTGLHPSHIGALPPQLAALNRTNINVQELTVQAALTGNRDYVRHALALDPLTGAICTLDQIRSMAGELLAAEAPWLPQFA
jgi:alpha-galactosidase